MDLKFCSNCTWTFKSDRQDDYHSCLAKARQNYFLKESAQKCFKLLDAQSQALEKLTERVAVLEKQKFNPVASPSVISLKGTDGKWSPVPLEEIQFPDTAQLRSDWYEGLEKQWKRVFNIIILKKEMNHEPDDDQLMYILETPTLRVVGPKGTNPNLDFELTNLSGLKHLKHLSLLVVTNHHLRSLKGIEFLSQLDSLFVNHNQIQNIEAVAYLSSLSKLYCNDNKIESLAPLGTLYKLESLHVAYNEIKNLKGLSEIQWTQLKDKCLFPNDKLSRNAIVKMRNLDLYSKIE